MDAGIGTYVESSRCQAAFAYCMYPFEVRIPEDNTGMVHQAHGQKTSTMMKSAIGNNSMSDIDRRRYKVWDEYLIGPPDRAYTIEHEGLTPVYKAEAMREVVHKLSQSKRSHFWVDDDTWYSCPKAPDGCCDKSKGGECTCGAEEWNAEIDELLVHYKDLL